MPYPIIIVGADGPNTFLLNTAAHQLLDQLALPEGSWQILEDIHVNYLVL